MLGESYTNTLFLAKRTKPLGTTAADGTFSVSLLAYSRPDGAAHALVPWRLVWSGDDALGFWCVQSAELTPGTPVEVRATRLRLIDGAGRHAGPELLADVVSLRVAVRALQAA